MRSVECEGESIDEAIAKALGTLQVERDRVEIEILTDATRGLFGFRGRKARVRATLRPQVGAASADVSREASDTTCEPASTPAPAAAARARALLEEILGHLGVFCAIAVREGDEPGSTVLAVSGEGSGLVTAGADLGGLVAESTARFGVELSSDALSRLARFVDLLALWNRRVRLTGEREARTLVRKHVLDCLAPVPHLPPAGVVVDVGSGAGLPGVVLGCARPDLDLCLVESRRRRASFLREAVRTIPLPRARVLEARAEALDAEDVVGKASVIIA